MNQQVAMTPKAVRDRIMKRRAVSQKELFRHKLCPAHKKVLREIVVAIAPMATIHEISRLIGRSDSIAYGLMAELGVRPRSTAVRRLQDDEGGHEIRDVILADFGISHEALSSGCRGGKACKARRTVCVSLARAGYGATSISRITGVHRSHVYKILERDEDMDIEPSYQPRPCPKPSRSSTAREAETLIAIQLDIASELARHRIGMPNRLLAILGKLKRRIEAGDREAEQILAAAKLDAIGTDRSPVGSALAMCGEAS